MHGQEGSNIPSVVPPPSVPPWSCPLPAALLLRKTLERAFRHHFAPDLQSKQLRTTTIERATCASLAIASSTLVSNETMCTILHQFQPFAWQIFAFFTPLLFRLAASLGLFSCSNVHIAPSGTTLNGPSDTISLPSRKVSSSRQRASKGLPAHLFK